jgi:hypothetical protein
MEYLVKIEAWLIRIVVMLSLLHTLYQVVKHEFGW